MSRAGGVITGGVAVLVVAGAVQRAAAERGAYGGRAARLADHRFDVVDDRVGVQERHTVDIADLSRRIDQVHAQNVRIAAGRITVRIVFHRDRLVIALEYRVELVIAAARKKAPVRAVGAEVAAVIRHHLRRIVHRIETERDETHGAAQIGIVVDALRDLAQYVRRQRAAVHVVATRVDETHEHGFVPEQAREMQRGAVTADHLTIPGNPEYRQCVRTRRRCLEREFRVTGREDDRRGFRIMLIPVGECAHGEGQCAEQQRCPAAVVTDRRAADRYPHQCVAISESVGSAGFAPYSACEPKRIWCGWPSFSAPKSIVNLCTSLPSFQSYALK